MNPNKIVIVRTYMDTSIDEKNTNILPKMARIVVDYREKILMDTLTTQKIPFHSKNLDVADIEVWYGEQLVFLIERKTVADYLNSISTYRLKNQLARMRTLSQISGARIIVLLEGSLLPQFGNTITDVPFHIYNSILNRILVEGIPVIRAETVGESVTWISKILEKISNFTTSNSSVATRETTVNITDSANMEYLETVKVKKSENINPTNCFLLQLRQIPGVSQLGAMAIKEQYSNFPKLVDGYRTLTTEKLRENMLAKILVGQRKLGPVLSKRIFQYLMEPDMIE